VNDVQGQPAINWLVALTVVGDEGPVPMLVFPTLIRDVEPHPDGGSTFRHGGRDLVRVAESADEVLARARGERAYPFCQGGRFGWRV
jgi:hypothetical protein